MHQQLSDGGVAQSPMRMLSCALVMACTVAACAHAHARGVSDLDAVIGIRVTTDRLELEPGEPLQITVRIVNRASTDARFGDKVSRPWLRIIYIGESGIPDGWIGTGEAVPPFVVGPGKEYVLNRTIRVGGSAPAGQYQVDLDNALQGCGERMPVLAIPATIRMRNAQQR